MSAAALSADGARPHLAEALESRAGTPPPEREVSPADRGAGADDVRRREHLYAAAVEASTLAVVTTDLDGNITAWSRGAEAMFGFAASEVLGRDIAFMVPPDRAGEAHANIRRIREGRPHAEIDTERLRKDGSRAAVAVRAGPIVDGDGATIGTSAIIRDISLQVLAEESFKLAVEACPSGMLMVDADGKIVMVNYEIERMFGYERVELIGWPVERLLPNELNDKHALHRAEFAHNPEARRMGGSRDLFGRRKDGSEFPVEVGLNPIDSASGALVLGVIVDISERKLAEEKFRLLVEACPGGLIMVDGEGRIALVNSEIERLFGYRRAELLGASIDMLVPEAARVAHRRHREEFATWPEPRKIGSGLDLVGRRKNGSEFAVEIGLNPIHMQDELLVLCVVLDISARKRMEELKDEFVSTVSHELRTPLTSIAASLGLLAGNAELALPDQARRLVTIAHSNSQRLVRLINDILDVEKLDSGKALFDMQRLDLRTVAEQAIEANRGFAASHAVELRLAADGDEAMVEADPDRLMQVITNLLSNAIKFSPTGAAVEVAVRRHDKDIRLSVRDHGPGVPPAFRARIFEKFAQADVSDDRQKGGTGLGLSIVKQIVARLGGEVGFDDAEGGGAVFHVDLPAWQAEHGDEPAAGSDRVLICDDYPGMTQMLAMQLAKFGYVSDEAKSGAEALGKATVQRYAAILVDLKLPDGDGISLIQKLRAQPQNRATPIVVISAEPERGRQDLRSAGLHVLDWMRKPVDLERLAAVLDRPDVRNGNERPHILHLDKDANVLRIVAAAMSASADVTSVGSVSEARKALASARFDLAVVDIDFAADAELLSELRDRDGDAIPLIAFSAADNNPTCARQIEAALRRKPSSIDDLVATLRKRLSRIAQA